MIKPDERFQLEGGAYRGEDDDPRAVVRSEIWDWNRLRLITIIGNAKMFPVEDCKQFGYFAPFADLLSDNVSTITVNENGELCQISTDPRKDETWFFPYIPISMAKSLADCRTIQFSKLRELDKLGPAVDLRSYQDEEGQQRKVIFKFYATYKPRPISMFWCELHLYHRLPPHPNLLALDRVVFEDVESRVIGFATRYISGGTLDNMAIVFRLEWLKQLLQVVDFLNLELGVMHQDIAPRNILLNTDTDKILLYDFIYSASKKDGQLVDQDDVASVTFTLYELITGDESFTAGHQRRNNINMVRDMPNWIPKRELDVEVSEFRRVLNDWITKRTAHGNMMERYLNATSPISIPEMPPPTDYAYRLPSELL